MYQLLSTINKLKIVVYDFLTVMMHEYLDNALIYVPALNYQKMF